MTVLAPVSGDPDAVELLARRLAVTGERLAAVAAVLVRLRDAATWDGPAGAAFGARLGAVPGVLDAAARRHLGAVAPLRALAAAMAEAQAVVRAAQREDDDARDEHARLEELAWTLVAGGTPESDPRLLAVRAHQRDEVARMQRAAARHAAALERFRAADVRCARALRSLAEDALADPGPYRLLRGASATGAGLGSLGALTPLAPELAPVALGGDLLAAGSDTALLVGYGEGEWSGVALGAALAGTGFAGGTLRSGATEGARVVGDAAEVTARLTPRERVLAGAAVEARRRVATLRARMRVPPERATPSALVGGPPPRPAGSALGRTAESARAAARAALDRAVLDDWRRATANGTRGMYTAGVTLQAGSAGARGALTDRRDDTAPASRSATR